jgi:predicted RNase H-like nuclease
MAETLKGIYRVPTCIVHTFDRVLRNRLAKEQQETFEIPCRQRFLRSKYARACGLRICVGLS